MPVAQSLDLSADLHLHSLPLCRSAAKDYHLALHHFPSLTSVFLLPLASSSHDTVTSVLLFCAAPPPPPCTSHVPSALLHLPPQTMIYERKSPEVPKAIYHPENCSEPLNYFGKLEQGQLDYHVSAHRASYCN